MKSPQWREVVWSALALMSASLPIFAQEKPVSSFTLITGQELAVCKAYVARLRNTSFNVDPFCDRSGGADTPGFTKLEYVPISTEEILRLYAPVNGFILHGDPSIYERHPGGLHRGVPAIVLDARDNAKQQELGARNVFLQTHPESWPKFFRYRPAIDLDNDGSVDDVIVWRPTGVACGYIQGANPDPERSGSYLIFLDAQGQFDVARTTAAFGKRPHPIGRGLGVFKYGKDFFFDSFHTGDEAKSGKSVKELADTLAVYRRSGGANSRQCEIKWNRAFTRNVEK